MAHSSSIVLVQRGALAPSCVPFRPSKKWVEDSSPLARDVIYPLRTKFAYLSTACIPTDVMVLARHSAVSQGLLP